MSKQTIVVTDLTTGSTVTVEPYASVAGAVRPWFQDMPAEVVEAIDQLDAAIAGVPGAPQLYELEAFLQIEVRPSDG